MDFTQEPSTSGPPLFVCSSSRIIILETPNTVIPEIHKLSYQNISATFPSLCHQILSTRMTLLGEQEGNGSFEDVHIVIVTKKIL